MFDCGQIFLSNKFENLLSVVGSNKFLGQIKLPISLYTYAPTSELPSNISTLIIIITEIRKGEEDTVTWALGSGQWAVYKS